MNQIQGSNSGLIDFSGLFSLDFTGSLFDTLKSLH